MSILFLSRGFPPVRLDAWPKWIDQEGLGKRRKGTRQGRNLIYIMLGSLDHCVFTHCGAPKTKIKKQRLHFNGCFWLKAPTRKLNKSMAMFLSEAVNSFAIIICCNIKFYTFCQRVAFENKLCASSFFPRFEDGCYENHHHCPLFNVPSATKSKADPKRPR